MRPGQGLFLWHRMRLCRQPLGRNPVRFPCCLAGMPKKAARPVVSRSNANLKRAELNLREARGKRPRNAAPRRQEVRRGADQRRSSSGSARSRGRMSRGFFSRVRGMLQSRQEAVILTPNSAIDRINDAERLLERKYDGTLRVLSERFCNESRKTKENITRLREGNLLNRNVEERHLHIMEGNRSAYIKKVEQFLE